MNVSHWLIVITCVIVLLQVSYARRHRRSTCVTHPRLRDKWHFLDQSKQVFIRIRAHQIVYKHGRTKVIKYRCIESQGNIYLLRKPKYRSDDDGVLCLGFSYVADHPKAEYVVLRLIGPGDGTHLFSPVITGRQAKLSIASTCDLQGNYVGQHPVHTTNAFIRRARNSITQDTTQYRILHSTGYYTTQDPTQNKILHSTGSNTTQGTAQDRIQNNTGSNTTQGTTQHRIQHNTGSNTTQVPGCKFPAEIRGRWNYTYQHARSLEIWQRNATLHLMNGESIRFLCDKRDGGVFVFRAKEYVSRDEDAIMCAEFTPMQDDPFYSFQMSRHNSGNLLDGQLRSVSKSRPVYVHVDCDWIGSPARPEFLYP